MILFQRYIRQPALEGLTTDLLITSQLEEDGTIKKTQNSAWAVKRKNPAAKIRT